MGRSFELDKWQASSHPELAERKPSELFAPECKRRSKSEALIGAI